jgi:CRISPR-associated endonuclease/helicase Cas3
MDDLLLRSLWGKTHDDGGYHPLLYHLLDVAAVTQALWPRYASRLPLDPAWVPFIAALHDIGKADPFFQNKDDSQAERLRALGITLPTRQEPFRHEARSAQWVRDYLRDDHGWKCQARNCVAQALHGHHGNFNSERGGDDAHPAAKVEEWDGIRRQIADCLVKLLAVPPCCCDCFADASAVGTLLAGQIVLADWIASNELLYPTRTMAQCDDPAAYLVMTRARAKRVVHDLGLADDAPHRSTPPLTFQEVWPACTSLRPSQQALEKLCLSNLPAPGLAIIEAPMGEGKTEAAIYLSTLWQGLAGLEGAYIALPTAATSNQMHARYETFLHARRPGKSAPRLVHGLAWLIDEETPVGEWQVDMNDPEQADRAQDWFRPSKRALLAPDAVGTVDQALMAALNVKHGFLRLFGLTGKVLIIDEAHAYDAYMTTILQRLLTWCHALHIPVILLSATLSHTQKQALVEAYAGSPTPLSPTPDYPLLTFVSPTGQVHQEPVNITDVAVREISVQQHPGMLSDYAAIAALALDEVENGGCACVLANTVDAAQAIYDALEVAVKERQSTDLRLLLFHARFRAERRTELEREVVGLFGKDAGKDENPPRPPRAILVATQVVEQSLDVDFDVMISQLAPIDLLLQRCGRMWRHARGQRPTGDGPVLHVLLPAAGAYEFDGSGFVYQHEPLLRTLSLLTSYDRFELPTDFRPLIAGCYDTVEAPVGIDPTAFATASAKRLEALRKEQQQAHDHLLPLPSARVFSLADNSQGAVRAADEEADGDTREFFHAKTRLGDLSRPVLVIHDAELAAVIKATRPPDREMLKQLFRQKVDLPVKWLRGVRDASGQPVCLEGPRWLRGHLVLQMTAGAWRGTDAKGCPMTITDDINRGILFEKKEV